MDKRDRLCYNWFRGSHHPVEPFNLSFCSEKAFLMRLSTAIWLSTRWYLRFLGCLDVCQSWKSNFKTSLKTIHKPPHAVPNNPNTERRLIRVHWGSLAPRPQDPKQATTNLTFYDLDSRQRLNNWVTFVFLGNTLFWWGWGDLFAVRRRTEMWGQRKSGGSLKDH